MRKTFEYGSTGSAVMDAPGEDAARPSAGKGRRRLSAAEPVMRPRRSMVDDYADDADTEAFLRASGRNRRIRRGLIPTTKYGRIAAGVGLLAVLAGLAGGAFVTMRFLETDAKFMIPSSQNLELDGNSHLTRAQMLSVFGEDIDRNIFKVPLEERRAELEKMPWVEHATVMRLMPNRIRVHVTERTPVAYVRQGSNVGLVDAQGVLLDIPPDAPGNPNYSFPVVTGLKAEDSPEGRAARMRLYGAFLKDLDSDGKGTSAQLSEVDVNDVEDVKALIPDHNAEVLVHFGKENFLSRYKKFEAHIDEWRAQYAHLASVDMRYERQVVLQMPTKETAAAEGQPGALKAPVDAPVAAPRVVVKPVAAKPVAAKVAVAAKRPVPVAKAGPAKVVAAKVVPAKAGAKAVSARDAATQKRIDAIKAWMAKREKLKSQQPSQKVSLLEAVPNRIEIRPVSVAPAGAGGISPGDVRAVTMGPVKEAKLVKPVVVPTVIKQ